MEERGTIEGPTGPIGWRRLGEGPPLLMVNGFTGSKDTWGPIFLDTLAAGATLICTDLRGIGDSGGSLQGLTVDAMARDMEALLEALDVGRVDLLGWSMGGAVVQALAARNPDRTKSLTLLSTDHGGPEAVRPDPEVTRILADASGSPEEQVRRLLALILPVEWAARVFEVAGELIASHRGEVSPELIAAYGEAREAWYRVEEPPIAKIEEMTAAGMPVLIACGLEDRVVPPVNSEMMSTRLPGAWLAPFSGGQHSMMAQEPRRLGDLVSVFLGHPGLR